ncbi:MAG: S8 family serine peptidase, partial [Chitinophagaceae bacterium]
MRTLSLLLLICAFPFTASSQSLPEKEIIRDYAHPAFAQQLLIHVNKIIFEKKHDVYLAASEEHIFNNGYGQGFAVLRQLSPFHAIIRITGAEINPSFFKYIVPASYNWKLSPTLLQSLKKKDAVPRLLISVTDADEFKRVFIRQLTIVHQYNEHVLIIQLNNSSALETLQASPLLLFADLAERQPKEELIIDGFDLGTNRVNAVHNRFPSITGEGLMLSVKENRFDSTDIDLKGRTVNSSVASATVSGHATIMATMAAGAGNSFYEGKGAAWKAGLQSATFANLLPEPDALYQAQRISVQNHSYGTGIENFYGADAAAYDASVINNPSLLHVFSAGNSGQLAGSG